jgi:anti-sigma regulatory factor (Ser/Thr protein kinase)
MITRQIARDADALPEVMLLSNAFFETTPAGPGVRFAVELALEEIFTNVVRHNARGQGPIGIALERRDGEVIVTITDPDAPRFDPVADGPDTDVDLPLDQRLPGGLGIHLVRKFMDRIEYSHHSRTGTIRLHKRTD